MRDLAMNMKLFDDGVPYLPYNRLKAVSRVILMC